MARAPPEECIIGSPASEANELFQNICDLCIYDNQRIEAKAYCAVCTQYFCLSCQKSHERANATKLHKILTGKDMPGMDINAPTRPTCTVHPGKTVEYFCLGHKSQCCVTCKVLNHTTCQTVVDIEKLASKENLGEDANLKLNGLRCIFDEFERLEKVSEKHITDLNTKRHNLITSIKDMRKSINEHLDKLETNILMQIDDEMNTCVADLEKQKLEMNSAKMELFQQIKSYEELQKAGVASKLSLMSATMDSKISKYVQSLNRIYDTFFAVDVTFTQNKMLKDFKCQVSSLGETQVDRFGTQIRRSYQERQPVYLDDVAYWSEGQSQFYAENVVLLPNGGLILSNRNTKTLKMFDANYKKVSDLVMKSEPWSVALLPSDSFSASDAFVALPNVRSIMSVWILNTTSGLVSGKTYKTKVPYYRMATYNGDLVANATVFAIGMDDSFYYFDLLDKHGKLLDRARKEQRPSTLFRGITSLCLSQDNMNVYITDTNNGCVGLSLDGNVVFKYKDETIECYSGICTDTEGFIYISGRDSDNLTMINDDGQKVKEVVKLTGFGPCAVAYYHSFNKLYVFHKEATIFRLFALI